MDTKLTLKINREVIKQAKQYARAHRISLSALIENYLKAITQKEQHGLEISPLVESLTGIIDPEKTDYTKDYTDFLTKKYS